MADSGIAVMNTVHNNRYSASVGQPGPWFTAANDIFNVGEGW